MLSVNPRVAFGLARAVETVEQECGRLNWIAKLFLHRELGSPQMLVRILT